MKFQLVCRKFELVYTPVPERCDWSVQTHWSEGDHVCSKPKAWSRAGGHFFLSNKATIPKNNSAILNIAHIRKHVMTPVTESELAALYIMTCAAVYIRTVLVEMGHIQLPTTLQTDNDMADVVCNVKIQPKRTK